MNPFHIFLVPDDIVVNVLSFLDPETLSSAARASRYTYELAERALEIRKQYRKVPICLRGDYQCPKCTKCFKHERNFIEHKDCEAARFLKKCEGKCCGRAHYFEDEIQAYKHRYSAVACNYISCDTLGFNDNFSN